MNTRRFIEVINLIAAICAANLFSDRMRGVVDDRSFHCLLIATAFVVAVRALTIPSELRKDGWAWREFCHGVIGSLVINVIRLAHGWSRTPPPLITLGAVASGLLFVGMTAVYRRINRSKAATPSA